MSSETASIDSEHLFELALKWGQRRTKPPLFTEQYTKRMVEDLKRFMDIKRRELDAPELVCEACSRAYPALPDLDVCPYCASGEAYVEAYIPPPIEVIELEPEMDEDPIGTELERSKEQMLKEFLDDIDSLTKKSVKALWEIGNRFMLIKQNKLHMKDDLNINDFGKWCEVRTGFHANTVDRLIRFHKTIPLEIIENAQRIQVSGLLAIDRVAKVFPAKKKEILARTVSHIEAMPQTTRYKKITIKEAEKIAKEIARKVVYNEDGTVANPSEAGIAILSKGYARKAVLKNYYGKNTKSIITKIPITYKIPFVFKSYDKETVENTEMLGRKFEFIFPATTSLVECEITKYGVIAIVKQTGKRLHHQLIPESQKLYESLEVACEDNNDSEED